METISALLVICAGNSPVTGEFPHKGQWRGALMFSVISASINGWANNREAVDLRRHCAHYDVTMLEDLAVKSTGLRIVLILYIIVTTKQDTKLNAHTCNDLGGQWNSSMSRILEQYGQRASETQVWCSIIMTHEHKLIKITRLWMIFGWSHVSTRIWRLSLVSLLLCLEMMLQ